MRTLGISIYPKAETFESDIKYVEKAAKLGFKRVFCCMISNADEDIVVVKERFERLFEVINSHDMYAIIDVSQVVFEKFNLSLNDLSFFHKIGAKGIRLDEGISAEAASKMTHNNEKLFVEVNASSYNNFVQTVLRLGANKDTLVSCHNFYPQKYTALSLKHFDKCNKELKELGIRISAFVTSREESAKGPWPVSEGVCTLEQHRFLPIDLQARHLFMLGVDEVIIGNAYATDEELIALSKIDFGKLTFKIKEQYELSSVENEILYAFPHHVRGDMSEYMARSTFPRIQYKDSDIKPQNCQPLKRGDVVILNNEYGRYKGEVHIITKEMDNEGNKNVVGKIDVNEQVMLDFIMPWLPFKIIKD